jgi:hypothetical protein
MIEIRSYRRVFELERRIYRIDRLRLNPAGVPVRGIVYFLALVATSLVLSTVPLIASAAAIAPWYMRALVLPALGAALLALIRVEGRSFHLAALALLHYRAAPRRITGGWRAATVGALWAPPALSMLPDGSGRRIRRLRYTGPGAALVARGHELTHHASRRSHLLSRRTSGCCTLALRELPDARPLSEANVIVLERGSRIVTEPARSAPRQPKTPHRGWPGRSRRAHGQSPP